MENEKPYRIERNKVTGEFRYIIGDFVSGPFLDLKQCEEYADLRAKREGWGNWEPVDAPQ